MPLRSHMAKNIPRNAAAVVAVVERKKEVLVSDESNDDAIEQT